MEYVFRTRGGMCPQCIAFGKVFFIQDRHIGGEKYEYALMSRPIDKKVSQKFQDEKEMVSFLFSEDIADSLTANLLLNYMISYQSAQYCMIEHDGVKYVWDRIKNELREYIEPVRETGWCNSYLECLNIAKEILKKKEFFKSKGEMKNE